MYIKKTAYQNDRHVECDLITFGCINSLRIGLKSSGNLVIRHPGK